MKLNRTIMASVAALGFIAVGAGAMAEPAGDSGRPAATREGKGGNFDPAAMAEQRLSRLKADLKVTSEQEPLWTAFADKVKGEAGKGLAAMREQAKETSLTAPERMSRGTELLKQRVAAMESINESFKRLYDALTPEQRKVADEHAARMGEMRMHRAAHHGPKAHRAPPPAEPTKG